VVKKEEVTSFFEEKLTILGLNDREKTDFITFWAPKMDVKDYYYINFPNEIFDSLHPLTVSPRPDSIQRVFMVYEGLDEKVNVKQQPLTPFSRSGFSVIEWGGSEIEG